MAQAGIHALVSLAVRKWTPQRTWLILGIVLGSIIPDADTLAVAVATVAKLPTQGLHRTFTHSLFTIVVVWALFYAISKLTKNPRWNNLGMGLGIGILLHILLDLLIWFDGVAILWPLPAWINLWSGVTPPVWWMKLMLPVELLFFALLFISLYRMARSQGSDLGYLGTLRIWTGLQILLFIVFTVLAYTLTRGFLTIFGAIYLLSLALAVGVIIRMRSTIEGGGHLAST